MPSKGPSLVSVSDLRKLYYPHAVLLRRILRQEINPVRAVDGVSLEIRQGETLGLVGESGSGKSTLGRLMLRLEEPTTGSIIFDGEDLLALHPRQLQARRKHFQMIFQDPYSSLNPRMRVGQMLSEVLLVHRLCSPRVVKRRVAELLELVEMPASAASHYPAHFSGGQRQRIGIARALAIQPKLIIADEPVSALDVSVQSQILNLINRLKSELSLTWVFISHNLAVVRQISDRVAVMYLGQIFEKADSQTLYERPLHPYTVSLLSAVPIPDPTSASSSRQISLTGETPSPIHLPKGCRFHPRCWLKGKLGNPTECTTTSPLLREVSPNQLVACHFAERVQGSPEQAQALGRKWVGPLKESDANLQ